MSRCQTGDHQVAGNTNLPEITSRIDGAPGLILQMDGVTTVSISFANDEPGAVITICVVRHPVSWLG